VRVDRLAAAALVATVAFWAYTQTLLPGVDLGDTGGFQAAVLWPATSARQAYPLYYDLARPFVSALSAAHPARGLNLFSAVWGGVACGLLTWVVAAITESILAGAASGLLLAFSYTFWSQAIIAEVYTLHLALVGLCLLALHWWASRPRTVRLALFFAIFALAFGNHLSMILLLAPFTIFLLRAADHPRELLRPAVVTMALLIAVAGALQYTPNLLAVGSGLDGPHSFGERLADFWFDTTKADWRDTMVLGLPGSQVTDRLAMWGWDARQQFGLFGLALAVVGAVRLWRFSPSWAMLTWSAFAINTLFAFTYNVGDSHVFFLPSHYFTALCVGVAFAPRPAAPATASPSSTARSRRLAIASAPIVLILYASWRGWDTWPAIDRHADRRAERLVARLASGIDERRAVLVSDMNWQIENAILYTARWERPDLTWTRLPEVLLHFPFFVGDNQAIGREVVLTADAAAGAVAAYGPLFPIVRDDALPAPSLGDRVAALPRGSIYVLCLLTPPREERFDAAGFDRALQALSGGHAPARESSGYEVWAGIAGERPAYHRASPRPFRDVATVLDERFTLRMDSWLPGDTFRRAGFGHIIHGRDHAMIVERGVSLLWIPPAGAIQTGYTAGLYAPTPRYRIPTAIMSLAALPERVAERPRLSRP
jgi:hypothetical protein